MRNSINKIHNVLNGSIERTIRDVTYNATRDATFNATWAATIRATLNATWDATRAILNEDEE